jgi:tetratricopeptide (TPR) repeat protein
VWCSPLPIEAMLLEYARLKDEWETLGAEWSDSEDVVLQRLDSGPSKGDLEKLHRSCEGTSTLLEISDRLGWPLRQTRSLALGELRRGGFRFSTPPELLYLVQHELARSQTERAAARLRAWVAVAPGGPLAEIDAHAFISELEAGHLQPVLHALKARQARVFLRRLDHGAPAAQPALARWKDHVKEKANDRTAQVRVLSWQLRASVDPNTPSIRDLLALARLLLRENKRIAAGSVLRIAAARAPETASVRLEVGQVMIQAGFVEEAAPFVMDVVRPLIERGRAEEAVSALRALSEAQPGNREARRLYLKSRAQSVQRTLVRKHSVVTITVLVALSVGALVQYHSYSSVETKMAEVLALAEDPTAALIQLDATFPGDDSPRIAALRADLTERQRIVETGIRTAWTDEYNAAAVECAVGDVLLGLRRTLALRATPPVREGQEPLPLVSDLYNGLAARMETQVVQLGEKIEDTKEQIQAEARLISLLRSLEEAIGEKTSEIARSFKARIEALRKKVEARDVKRSDDRDAREAHDHLSKQDVLINKARAHEKAGDHKRALDTYEKLLETDPSGKLKELFKKEIEEVKGRVRAIDEARKLAEAGRQVEAHDLLKKFLEDPDAWLLPWKIETVPPGARAKLADGSERSTPLTLESTWNQVVPLRLELEGHETYELEVAHPADQRIALSRVPERAWAARGRVEAPPVAVGDDHVVVDRAGGIARLSRKGQIVWEADLNSLGGVARAPVFLPGRAGSLLVVTEDGEVWIVNAADGAMEGPWACGSQPIAGPTAALYGVRVTFKSGETYEWSSRLKPDLVPAEGAALALLEGPDGGQGSSSGLAILRRRTNPATTFACPWAAYSVEIGADLYTLSTKPFLNEPPKLITNVHRSGEWTYVAWEAPNVSIPHGRLWISDGKGLRAFSP